MKNAELVILAAPATAMDDVVADLDKQLDGKVVVDVSNRVDPQSPAKVLDGSSMSEHVQSLVPRAHVVKAFNTAFASRQADPKVDGMVVDADDEQAKKQVLDFAKSIGSRPIGAGPLVMARVLEGMALLNIMLQIRNKWPWQQGWKLVGQPAA